MENCLIKGCEYVITRCMFYFHRGIFFFVGRDFTSFFVTARIFYEKLIRTHVLGICEYVFRS